MTTIRNEALPLPDADADRELGGITETIVARLTQRLRDDILSGELTSGARLKLSELSSRFGISPMPVRDALVKLAAEGLVELQPNRGASVRRIHRQFIENMFDIRMVLEELLVCRCIERSSDAELASLRPLFERHAKAVREHDLKEIGVANSEFHKRITALARNDDAARILEQGWELVHAVRGRAGYTEERLLQVVEDHRKLVDAIEARDTATAARLARLHVERSRDDILTRIKF